MTLLDIVQTLTQPEKVVYWVEGEGKRVMFTRTDPPLLDRVKAHIGSTVATGEGSGSSPASQRSLLDANAFALWHEVNGTVRSWCADAGVKAPKSLTESLSKWHVWFIGAPREDAVERRFSTTLLGFMSRSVDIVDPPQRIEITSPCPGCDCRWVVFGRGSEVERRSALSAWLRGRDDCAAECAACSRRWVGELAMRSLNVWIDEKRRAVEDAA